MFIVHTIPIPVLLGSFHSYCDQLICPRQEHKNRGIHGNLSMGVHSMDSIRYFDLKSEYYWPRQGALNIIMKMWATTNSTILVHKQYTTSSSTSLVHNKYTTIHNQYTTSSSTSLVHTVEQAATFEIFTLASPPQGGNSWSN